MTPGTEPSPWSERGARYASSLPHASGPSLPKLLALARPMRGDLCLDIGTGAGHTAAQLARYAQHVIALDPAEGMLKEARRLYGELGNLEFALASAEDTGLKGGTFDLVTARHTLHHHADLPATLAETFRLLKPGGRFVVVDEVIPEPAVEGWYDALLRLRDPTHVRAYTLEGWRSLTSKAGMVWIVGDDETRYDTEVASWLGRMSPNPEQIEAVYAQLERADAYAKALFKLTFEGGEVVRFKMPMALILAVKPG